MTITIKDLPFPAKRGHSKFTLPKVLYLGQWEVPSGTTVLLVTGTNFGFVVLPEKQQDVRGFTIPRRIFSH
jgi:hypothetical protein